MSALSVYYVPEQGGGFHGNAILSRWDFVDARAIEHRQVSLSLPLAEMQSTLLAPSLIQCHTKSLTSLQLFPIAFRKTMRYVT